jgi:hypothetical protein
VQSLDAFCTWLAATPASQTIQTVEWIIPAVQTVHILAVALVIASIVMVDMRLFGVGGAGETVSAVSQRYLPVVWWTLPVLLATGATLIVAEPARAIENPVFILKMGLLVSAIGVTLASQLPLRRDAEYWGHSAGRRRAARAIAALSIPLWIAIIFAGRWIAYVPGS